MKNLLIYVFAGILLVSVGSCSKNNNGPDEEDSLLVGTWNVMRGIEREFTDGELTYEFDSDNPDGFYEIELAQLQFMNNGKVKMVYDDSGDNELTDYKLSADGKTLSILGLENENEWGTTQIRKLTATDLELVINGENTDDGVSYRYEMEIFLKK